MRSLPPAFAQEMQDLFDRFGRSGEWPLFLASFAEKPLAGLRANTLKIDAAALRVLLNHNLKPVPWSDDGFYLPLDFQPGKLPWHSAGLYYIQEPSAMLPAIVLGAKPGERILDLCAAPGGKSCRIAADLRGEGLLWANEISSDRARALLHNVELTGCRNAIISQETPERLADRLPAYFDRILVDAPCSGSGMFRRDPGAMDSWQAYGSDHCTALQRGILLAAWTMLKPGGSLVYSTCTFSLAENEEMILWLTEQVDCQIEPIAKVPGIDNGLSVSPAMTRTARIWPHRVDGDGHFCARLSKPKDDMTSREGVLPYPAETPTLPGLAAWAAFDRFCASTLSEVGQQKLKAWTDNGRRRFERNCLHLLPPGAALANLKMVKTGLFLGQVRELRDKSAVFEPSQAFLFSLTPQDLRHTLAGTPSSDLIRRYLRGETLTIENPDTSSPSGFAAVVLSSGAQAWPLGWCKTMGPGLMKNLYPQAWRRQI